MTWPWQWPAASHERAVDNARQASTALSRGRVERDEVELFLQQRYAEPVHEAASTTLDAGVVRAAR